MKCLSAAEGGAAWHGDCAIFSRWWSAPAAPAVGVRGSIPRVGPRGIACLTETPVLRGFSLALMPSPPASRLPPPLPLTRTEGLATATTPEHSAGLAELMLGLPRNTGRPKRAAQHAAHLAPTPSTQWKRLQTLRGS